jgi:hypothetical protein
MEAEHRPTWRPPQMPALPAAAGIPAAAPLPTPAPTPAAVDTAEHYFPRDDRVGLGTSVLVLACSCLALLGAALTVLRLRDVH